MARGKKISTDGTQTYRECRTPQGWDRTKTGGVQVTRSETRDTQQPGCRYRVSFRVIGDADSVALYVNECLPTVGGVVFPDGTFEGVWHY